MPGARLFSGEIPSELLASNSRTSTKTGSTKKKVTWRANPFHRSIPTSTSHHGCSQEDAQIRANEARHRTTRRTLKKEPNSRRNRIKEEGRCPKSQTRNSSSPILHVLHGQRSPRAPLPRPHRHKLPLAHGPRQTRAPRIPHEPPLRKSHPHHNVLRHGRARKTRSKIPHRAPHRARRALGANHMRPQGHLRRRLPRRSRHQTPHLPRRHQRRRLEETAEEDPRRAHRECGEGEVCD